MPGEEARVMILKIHCRKMKLLEDVNFEEIVLLTEGMSGSDLKAIAMEAGMFAVREERLGVGKDDFLKAIKKLKASGEKPNLHDEGMFV
jgi:proteasome regulatory subunit